MKKITNLAISMVLAVTLFNLQGFGAEIGKLVSKRPVIFWMPHGTYKNHFIAGSNFVPGQTRVWIEEAPNLAQMTKEEQREAEQKLLKVLAHPSPGLPSIPPTIDTNSKHAMDGSWRQKTKGWRVAAVNPWLCRTNVVAFENTTMWGAWGLKISRIYWVQTPKGFSKPFVGNAVDPWFAFPMSVQPGQWIRVIGRGLEIYHRSVRLAAIKEISSGKIIRAEWGLSILTNNDAGESSYQTYVKIPNDCSSGWYELYLHNGSNSIYGWSLPIHFFVSRKFESDRFKTQVLTFPGGMQDHFAAWLNKRLSEIAARGGGIAILPHGRYMLHNSVNIPSKVVLRGVSRGGVELLAEVDGPAIVMKSGAALENLTVKSLNGMPAVQVGNGNEMVVNVRLNKCLFYTKSGGKRDPRRHCGLVILSPSRNLSIRDCNLKGRCLVGLFGKAEHFELAYCEAGLLIEGGLENSVVEYNVCRDMAGTFFIRLGNSDVRHNLFAWNKFVKLKPIDLPMGLVFDGSLAGGNAKVIKAQTTKLLVRNNTYEGDPTGKWIVVVSGHCRGLVRRISSGTSKEVRFDEPLPAIPETNDKIYIGPLILQNLVADNMDIRHRGGLEFLGACIDNTLVSHISDETRGVAFLGTRYRGYGSRPCYYNMIDHVDVFYGGTAGVGVIGSSGVVSDSLAFANLMYNVSVYNSRWVAQSLLDTLPTRPDEQVRWGGIWFVDRSVSPDTNSVTISDNAVMESSSCGNAFGAGFYVGDSVLGTIFKDVVTYGNVDRLRDFGRGTVRK